MKTKLFFIRKIKALFLKFHLHLFFTPFSGSLLNLSYLSALSNWRKTIPQPAFNDFYNPKVDYAKRYELYTYLFERENLDTAINYLEFGVAQGHSFKWWIEKNKNEHSRFVGFDTFTGLPENWNIFRSGAMSTQGKLPAIDDSRGRFVVGLFQDTLPSFLDQFPGDQRLIIHLDADLYSSTLYVLTSLARKLKKGDILIFDEFGVPMHEFKAFTEFVQAYRINYEVLGAVNNYLQIVVKIV